MGTVPNSTPNYQQKETDQGQLYTFGSNQFLVETKVFREQITLDMLFERIYEDNATGKISDDRFKKLASKYEAEQQSIGERIDELKKKYDEVASRVANTDTFLKAVRKYTRIKKLTPRILTELIDHIDVHEPEMVNGSRLQRIVIHYNCIDTIEIPGAASIPTPEITVNTRKGVTVTYEPAQSVAV